MTILKDVSWTLLAWRLSRPRMPWHQLPCSTRIHAQRDVEKQRLLLQAAQRAGDHVVKKRDCKSGNKAPNVSNKPTKAPNVVDKRSG
jgi:hypothetical protein